MYKSWARQTLNPHYLLLQWGFGKLENYEVTQELLFLNTNTKQQ